MFIASGVLAKCTRLFLEYPSCSALHCAWSAICEAIFRGPSPSLLKDLLVTAGLCESLAAQAAEVVGLMPGKRPVNTGFVIDLSLAISDLEMACPSVHEYLATLPGGVARDVFTVRYKGALALDDLEHTLRASHSGVQQWHLPRADTRISVTVANGVIAVGGLHRLVVWVRKRHSRQPYVAQCRESPDSVHIGPAVNARAADIERAKLSERLDAVPICICCILCRSRQTTQWIIR